MENCPKCKSTDLHRSRTRTKWEAWRREISGKRMYRCRACGWRGWGPDTGPRVDEAAAEFASKALALEPPNLGNTGLIREEKQPDLNLERLDETDAASRRK